MRFFAALFFLSLAGCVSHSGPTPMGVTLTRVWPGWREADSFTRISEYFSGKENTGGEIILRSQSSARGGYYFLVRVNNPEGVRLGDRLVAFVIRPDTPDTKTYIFPVALAHGSAVYDLGVTGADWPLAKKPAVAWKIELQNSDGVAFDSRQSFLWAKPAQ